MTTIVNRTPHPINIHLDDGTVRTIPVSLPTPRVASKRVPLGMIQGIAIDRPTYGEVNDLPPAEDDTLVVVSLMVAQAVPERKDLLVPGEVVRDPQGTIVGCKGLSRV